jgi:hypothetical protein
MQRCSPTLALAALHFLVAAIPLDGDSGSRISIGLAKHSGFLNTEGFVVLEKVQTTIWHSVALVFHVPRGHYYNEDASQENTARNRGI